MHVDTRNADNAELDAIPRWESCFLFARNCNQGRRGGGCHSNDDCEVCKDVNNDDDGVLLDMAVDATCHYSGLWRSKARLYVQVET